ncbi:MAG: pyridoxamine 5'-phosphate oxidase [Saprospiraceae bacterium]
MAELDLKALRRSYTKESLSKEDVASSPLVQFKTWFDEAVNSEVLEPNAMTLATADAEGRPSARTVLLKELDASGFVFFTNYESKKGKDMAANPAVSLLFTWLELERQIRIDGRVERITAEESRTYFQSRPKSSQMGAWASPQSRVIQSRHELEHQLENLAIKYAEEEVLPLPAFWGGYRVIPHTIEFWQGRESRLHDRIQYRLTETGWQIDRLAP